MASLVCEAFAIHFVAFADAQVAVLSDLLLKYVHIMLHTPFYPCGE